MSKAPNFGRVQSAEHYAFGRTLSELRARRDLSQERLGFRCNLHRNYIGAIERGEINPTLRIELRLARGLRMPLSQIFALYEERRDEHLLTFMRAKEAAP